MVIILISMQTSWNNQLNVGQLIQLNTASFSDRQLAFSTFNYKRLRMYWIRSGSQDFSYRENTAVLELHSEIQYLIFLKKERPFPNLYLHHIMQLKRNVQEKSWFCKGHLQKSVGRVKCPAMHTAPATASTGQFLFSAAQLLQGGKSSSLLSLNTVCFTFHSNVLEYRSFRIFFPVCKSSYARHRQLQLANLCGKGWHEKGSIKDFRGLGSPELLHQIEKKEEERY